MAQLACLARSQSSACHAGRSGPQRAGPAQAHRRNGVTLRRAPGLRPQLFCFSSLRRIVRAR
eukprot:6188174-Pleurochrysis_carterae.AAC.2